MIIIGASGHASVVIEILEALDVAIHVVYDGDVSKKRILEYAVSNSPAFDNNIHRVIAIGDNHIRKKLSQRFDGPFAKAIIHPSAVVSKTAHLGEGTVVMPGAIINANVKIGKHVIVNSAAVIEHDCVIEDYTHISPNVALAGNVTVKSGTHVGIGASVVQGITIGKSSIIGAGAVVAMSIPENCTAVGIPAKPIKFHESAKK